MDHDAEVRRTCEALARAHPHAVKMRPDAILQAVLSLSGASEDILEVAKEILQNHTLMRMLPEADGGWNGRPPRWIPTLRAWIYAKGRDPVEITKPEARQGGSVEF